MLANLEIALEYNKGWGTHKDWRIRSVNELGILSFLCNATCNILTNANYPNDTSVLVTPRCSIQEDFNPRSCLCNQREFKVSIV